VRVVVTRPADQARPLVERLEALGHDVAVCPLIEIEPTGPDEVDVSCYDWLVVTSANAARELAARMRGRPARVAAIGPGTAAALPHEPDLVPRVSTQEGLLAELPRRPGRVLFAGAEDARRLVVDEVGADFMPLYRTKQLRPRRARLALRRSRICSARARHSGRLDRAGDDSRRTRGRRRGHA
jgi:uroporphyrinogen-III synthase